MTSLWQSINKTYLASFTLVGAVIFSVALLFLVQFRVESLQRQTQEMESEIASYQDKMQLLEVEWVYLTRPQRLRVLANKYLTNNSYIIANQIKNFDKLEKFYFANYKKSQFRELALAR